LNTRRSPPVLGVRGMNFRTVIGLFSIALVSSVCVASPISGKVAVWHGGRPVSIIVPLLSDSLSVLRNDRLSLSNAPTNFTPDKSGCFCFNVDDERFAFVHSYYYADQQIAETNEVLGSLGLPPVGGVTLFLSQGESGSTSGGTTDFDGKSIRIHYVRPAIDVSVLAHEVGHAIHMQIVSKPFQEILAVPDDLGHATLQEYKLLGFQFIFNRRKQDETRHRDVVSIDSIKKELAVQDAMLSSCSVLSGSPLKTILNDEGKVEEAAMNVIKAIGF